MLLDRRNDGSIALFIDGDLQFDSRDERTYHECLALPALALAESRNPGSLKALIIGGGDGLTARELLKSDRVTHLDLVDYDSEIVALARNEFAALNNQSMSDTRVNVHIEDAREFVKRALADGTTYDVIVIDLTAAHDAEAAQLYSVDFYSLLHDLLTDSSVLAVNSASPSGTPEAYWSIFNSLLLADLNPRPYSIVLPSFAEQEYGEDWGFILTARRPIQENDFGDQVKLVEQRSVIKDVEHIRNLFALPEEVLDRQNAACAAKNGSDILVHYLFNANSIETESETQVDTLSIHFSKDAVPVHAGSQLLPQELISQLGEDVTQKEVVLEKVLDLMPALRRHQTRDMINEFLAEPSSFLAPIDLPALVNQLLARASELSQKLVEELKLLKEKIVEYANDHERLFELGTRSLAIIAVVVIIGNLLFPDSVYAKGAAGSHHAAAHAGGRGARGARGVSGTTYNTGVNGHWGNWYTNANGKRTRNWIP
jgi:spermidine synthase